MNVTELLSAIDPREARLAPQASATTVRDVTHDSRCAQAGSVFVAVSGEKVDGLRFVPDAVARGAAAVVAQSECDMPPHVSWARVADARLALARLSAAFFGHPSRIVQTTAVTGTNGKSTTCHYFRSILRASGRDAGLLGTLTYETGKRSIPASMTTPEAPDIQRYLSEMAEAGLRYAVMETSSHSLAQKRVHGLRFAVAVFTNLTPEHLDWHKTFEAYRDAKAILFQGLDADAFAVLNTDDAASQHFADRTRAGKLWYGFDPKADFWAEIRRADLEHVEFELHTPAGKTNVALKMLGRHNVSNAMAAAAAAYAQGVDLDAISRGLAALEGVPGRVDRVDCRQPYAVVIDFAHTHDALEAVLRALRPCVPGRLLVVFGAGGDRDRLKRPRMGEVVSRLADAAWVTSDNPRSEDPMAIIAEIMAGAARPERLRVQPDRRLAIHEAISAARAGDLCLIAGKGHERVQIFRDDAVPFDDREVVMSYFARRAAS